MNRSLTLTLVLVLVLGLGCGVPTVDSGNCNAVTCAGCCDMNGDCRRGIEVFACGTNGATCLTCSNNSSCTNAGVCAAPAGERCSVNADCRSGLCSTAWPAGNACATNSCTSTSCQSGETCLRFTDGSSTCAKTCSRSTDCRFEYMCIGASGVASTFCYPDCRRNSGFCGTRTCNSTSGLCQ